MGFSQVPSPIFRKLMGRRPRVLGPPPTPLARVTPRYVAVSTTLAGPIGVSSSALCQYSRSKEGTRKDLRAHLQEAHGLCRS